MLKDSVAGVPSVLAQHRPGREGARQGCGTRLCFSGICRPPGVGARGTAGSEDAGLRLAAPRGLRMEASGGARARGLGL